MCIFPLLNNEMIISRKKKGDENDKYKKIQSGPNNDCPFN